MFVYLWVQVCVCVSTCVYVLCAHVCACTPVCAQALEYGVVRGQLPGVISLLPLCEFQEPLDFMAMPLLAEHLTKPRKTYFVSWFHGFASVALSSIESGPMIRQNTTEMGAGGGRRCLPLMERKQSVKKGLGYGYDLPGMLLGIYFLQT